MGRQKGIKNNKIVTLLGYSVDAMLKIGSKDKRSVLWVISYQNESVNGYLSIFHWQISCHSDNQDLNFQRELKREFIR